MQACYCATLSARHGSGTVLEISGRDNCDATGREALFGKEMKMVNEKAAPLPRVSPSLMQEEHDEDTVNHMTRKEDVS